MGRNVEMFMQVQKGLIQAKCLTNFFIRLEVDKDIASKVKDVIKRHQGTIAGTLLNLM